MIAGEIVTTYHTGALTPVPKAALLVEVSPKIDRGHPSWIRVLVWHHSSKRWAARPVLIRFQAYQARPSWAPADMSWAPARAAAAAVAASKPAGAR